jgi:hypothetical protein
MFSIHCQTSDRDFATIIAVHLFKACCLLKYLQIAFISHREHIKSPLQNQQLDIV